MTEERKENSLHYQELAGNSGNSGLTTACSLHVRGECRDECNNEHTTRRSEEESELDAWREGEEGRSQAERGGRQRDSRGQSGEVRERALCKQRYGK